MPTAPGLLPEDHGGHPGRAMPTLLIVHHTTSPPLHAMFDAVVAGATDRRIEGVAVVTRAALAATAVDVLAADGFVLGTPANLGFMSGALKHFFDQVYYPCLEDTRGRPYALYVHGNNDTTGAVRGVETIVTGLQWRRVHDVLSVVGPPGQDDLDACRELGATVAAGLSLDA
jgi:multimeric flavodoxin WrbA